ncbi:MAG: hypothetical protein JNM00_03165 [Flavobacteriales bacterium]|nr:hypothetical protein [Flavobacteriales bacterium]
MKSIINPLTFVFICFFHLPNLMALPESGNEDPGDTCGESIPLFIGYSCDYTSYTTGTFTGEDESQAPPPSCGNYSGNDMWFEAVIPSNGQLRIQIVGFDNFFPCLAIYQGTCATTLDELVCKTPGSQLLTYLIHEPQMAGTTLSIRIWNYNSTDSGSFILCAYNPAYPAYDARLGALELPVESACNFQEFTSAGFGASIFDSNPSCGVYVGADAWFKVEVPVDGHLRIETEAVGPGFPMFSIYTSIEAHPEHELICSEIYQFTLHDASLAGQWLYIRVWNWYNEEGLDFNICAWRPEIPDNDYCADAVLLSVGSTCTMQNFDNEYCDWVNETCVNQTNNNTGCDFSTGGSEADYPSCGIFQGGDVWFKFVMPASGHLRVERQNLSAQEMAFALYSGTCGNLSEIECANFRSSMNIHRDDLAGQILYLRVWSYYNHDGAPFAICVWEPPMPDNDFCSDALLIPVSDTCEFQMYSNWYCTSDDFQPDPTCGIYSGGDIWFKFVMPASGHLRIERGYDDYQLRYSLHYGPCGSEIRCTDGLQALNIHNEGLAGQTMYLRVWNFFNHEGDNFELCVWEPDIPDNDFCAEAIALPITDPCTFHTVDYVFCTTSPESTPTCAFYAGTDIWYTIQVPADGKFNLIKNSPYFWMGEFALYTGACNNLTEYGCYSQVNQLEFDDISLANETLYLRFFSYASEVGAVVTVNINHGATGCVGDFDANEVVNISDLLLFIATFGTSAYCSPYDLDGNQLVNTSDLLLMMAAYGSTCE